MEKDKANSQDDDLEISPADAVLTRVFELFQDRQHKFNALVRTVEDKEEELGRLKNKAIRLESEIHEACDKFGFKSTVDNGRVRLIPPQVVTKAKEKEWRCSMDE